MAQIFQQAEIWYADLNPRFGTEPGKIRPVIIVQTDLLNGIHPSTIICPITTKVKNDVEILRIHLNKSNSGLSKPSDVLVDQIRAIDNKRFIKKIGKLKAAPFLQLQKNIRDVLDME
jgi:mRNA interferase MazF